MIDLGTTEFYIAVPSLPKNEFEEYSTHLFDEWEKHLEQRLILPDYSLSLEVEEGSVKGWGTIGAVLYALYMGVGNYGSFISGLQTIKEQISNAGDFLAEQAGEPFSSSGVLPKVSKRSGALGALHRLFVKVQRGEMTPEQAMREAERLLGEDAEVTPEFMQKLGESFDQIPLFHQQLTLSLETQEGIPIPFNEKKRAPRSTPSKPVGPPSSQFRVEVWRESKKKKRNIRVVQL